MGLRSSGGFLYRDASGNSIYNPATLAGGTGIPAATAPIRYKTGGHSYGYEVNSVGAGKLDGRPAVVDQPFGSGRAFLFASDPFFRAWHESVERQALNALIYPTGAVLPAETAAVAQEPVTPAEAKATHAAAVEPVAEPIAAKELPAIKSRPLASTVLIDADIRITVHSFDAKALRKAVRVAKLPKKLQKRVTYRASAGKFTLVIRGARASSATSTTRASGSRRSSKRLRASKVKPLSPSCKTPAPGGFAPGRASSEPPGELLAEACERARRACDGAREGRRTAGPPCSRCRSFSRGAGLVRSEREVGRGRSSGGP